MNREPSERVSDAAKAQGDGVRAGLDVRGVADAQELAVARIVDAGCLRISVSLRIRAAPGQAAR